MYDIDIPKTNSQDTVVKVVVEYQWLYSCTQCSSVNTD